MGIKSIQEQINELNAKQQSFIEFLTLVESYLQSVGYSSLRTDRLEELDSKYKRAHRAVFGYQKDIDSRNESALKRNITPTQKERLERMRFEYKAYGVIYWVRELQDCYDYIQKHAQTFQKPVPPKLNNSVKSNVAMARPVRG
ncbi:MAG: hypothetical protein ACRCXZ_02825 [Patescibacteria group bacterium]